MTVITIEATTIAQERKREIAELFTNEYSRITGIPKEPIVVLFHELPLESIFCGGKMLK